VLRFGRKKAALLGVDIGSTSVKLVDLSQDNSATGSALRVEHYAIEPLPANAMAEKKILDVEAVGDGIRRALRRSGAKTKTAAVAVSGSAAITRVVSLSSTLSDAEMEAQIQLEADQHIPYPLEEVNIDFDVLGPSDSGADRVDVLLAATRCENVADRLAALEVAGLTAAVVDIETYAMENACALLPNGSDEKSGQGAMAVVDIGATTATFQVLQNGQTRYFREQGLGGIQLLDEIQRRYAVTPEPAMQGLSAVALPPSLSTEVVAPVGEALALQIERALQSYRAAGGLMPVAQIVLAGEVPRVTAIDRLVEERLGISTVVADPFAQMAVSRLIRARDLWRDAPALMLAVGLALRGFD